MVELTALMILHNVKLEFKPLKLRVSLLVNGIGTSFLVSYNIWNLQTTFNEFLKSRIEWYIKNDIPRL